MAHRNLAKSIDLVGYGIETAAALSLNPGVGDLLTIAVVMRTENEKLETIGARLKGADDLRGNPDRVKRPDIGDLAVELDSPSAGQNDTPPQRARGDEQTANVS
jgi:hypothetical protein